MGRHSPHTNQPNRRIPRPWQSRSPNRSLRALGDFGRFDAGVSAERGLVVFALNGHGLPALTNPRPALFERSQSGGNPQMFCVAHSEDGQRRTISRILLAEDTRMRNQFSSHLRASTDIPTDRWMFSLPTNIGHVSRRAGRILSPTCNQVAFPFVVPVSRATIRGCGEMIRRRNRFNH